MGRACECGWATKVGLTLAERVRARRAPPGFGPNRCRRAGLASDEHPFRRGRQRLRLAGALLGEPRLLLLHEPLASLDLRRQGAFLERVRNLQGRLGMTVLFTAHDINALLAAVDRVLYLGHGQAALGTVEEVITGPVLSRLYGVPVEVVRMAGRIAVLAPGTELQDQHVTV